MRATLLAVMLIAILSASVVGADHPTEQERQDLKTWNYTTTLTLVTALRGDQLAAIAAGQMLPLETMTDAARSQVLSAELSIAGAQIYDSWLGSALGLPDAKPALRISPDFSVEIKSRTLESSQVKIPLSELTRALSSFLGWFIGALPGDWRPNSSVIITRDFWLAFVTDDTYTRKSPPAKMILPSIPDPPPLARILTEAPTDPGPKVPWLKQKAFDILGPIGENRLRMAGGIPFKYADFAENKTFGLESLTPEQSLWVQHLYALHKGGRKAPSLPDWERLQNVSVKLNVVYHAGVSVLQRVPDDSARQFLWRPISPDDTGPIQERQNFPPGEIPAVYKAMNGKGLGLIVH